MSNIKKAIIAGAKSRCPVCHKGRLFVGYLQFADKCEICSQSFDLEDAGDGPAVFVIFVASAIIVPLALAFQAAFDPPIWVLLIIWLPIIAAACLALLRPFKGMMFAAQIINDARQGQIDDSQNES